jgi:hypothetical protein
MIEHFFRSKRNVIIVRDDEQRGYGNRQRIDLWWGGLKGNGGLMMILAYLVQSDLSWNDAQVHLKMVVPNEAAAESARANLAPTITQLRTGAELDVIVGNGRPFDEILHTHSKDADLVFMGMAAPNGDFTAYFEQLRTRTDGLPSTVYVLAAEEIAFREVLMQNDTEEDDS